MKSDFSNHSVKPRQTTGLASLVVKKANQFKNPDQCCTNSGVSNVSPEIEALGNTTNSEATHTGRHSTFRQSPVVANARMSRWLIPNVQTGFRAKTPYRPTQAENNAVEKHFCATTVHNSLTKFYGQSRVAQVLRWYSNLVFVLNEQAAGEEPIALKASRIKTPEVQTALVGNRIMTGTNAKDDTVLREKLEGFFDDTDKGRAQRERLLAQLDEKRHTAETALADAQEAYTQSPTSTTQGLLDNACEKLSVVAAQIRQVTQLIDFAADRAPLLDRTVAELEEQLAAGTIEEEDLETRSQMMINLHAALNNSTLRSVSDGLEDKLIPDETNLSQHCEQRVIEEIQNGQFGEDGFQKLIKFHYPKSKEMIVVLAGCKPPCLTCYVTEVMRDLHATEVNDATKRNANSGAGGPSRANIIVERLEDPDIPHGAVYFNRDILNTNNGTMSERIEQAIHELFARDNVPLTFPRSTKRNYSDPDGTADLGSHDKSVAKRIRDKSPGKFESVLSVPGDSQTFGGPA